MERKWKLLYYNRVYVGVIVPLKQIEYGVYEGLIIVYPKPCSIYLRGTTVFRGQGSGFVGGKV